MVKIGPYANLHETGFSHHFIRIIPLSENSISIWIK